MATLELVCGKSVQENIVCHMAQSNFNLTNVGPNFGINEIYCKAFDGHSHGSKGTETLSLACDKIRI